MKYQFEVPGEIVGKERPRVNMYTGRVYTPGKTKDYEFLIQQYFKIKYPRYEMLEGRLSINIIAYLKIPKSTSKAKVEEMLENKISPTKKPDVDNIAKSILDAMNNRRKTFCIRRKSSDRSRRILNCELFVKLALCY